MSANAILLANVMNPIEFAIGDGVTTQFDLLPANQIYESAVVADVFRQDWQGLQEVYDFQRTNFFAYSQDLSQTSAWTPNGLTVTTTGGSLITAPDGSITAQPLTDTTANVSHNIFQAPSLGSTPGACNTYSIWLKAGTQRYVQLNLDNNGQGGADNGIYAVFDLVNGVISKAATTLGVALPSQAAATMSSTGNGWYRCSVTGIADFVSTQRRGSVVFSNVSTGVGWYGAYAGTGTNVAYAWGGLFEVNNEPSAYFETTSTYGTLTDYYFDSDAGQIDFTLTPAQNAILLWDGTYSYRLAVWLQTVMSQYANSPILMQLIQNMLAYFDPSANIDSFFKNVFNILTAQGYGLDMWGRILGVNRVLEVATVNYMGFTGVGGPLVASGDSLGGGPTNPALQPFYDGQVTSSNYALSDPAYRTLLLAKALANISSSSIPAINQLLINLFLTPVEGRTGNAFCTDNGNMTMTYTFTVRPQLTAAEIAIINQSGVLPKPCGVQTSLVQL